VEYNGHWVLQTGAQIVPIYPTISEQDYEYILNHSEACYCFVSDKEVLAKINSIRDKVPHLKDVFSFDIIADCKKLVRIING
jgi:long-chain acyl-CoA synthetase